MHARISVLVLLSVSLFPLPPAAADNVGPAGLFEEMLFRANFDDSANADVHKGDPSAQVEGPMEFDGMIWTEMTLTPTGSTWWCRSAARMRNAGNGPATRN